MLSTPDAPPVLLDQPLQPTMLVIDDDAIQRAVISRVAEKSGFQTVCANSLGEASTLLGSQPFTCITLDLSLDGRHGVELLKWIACFNSKAKLIIISGLTSDAIKMTAEVAESLSINLSESLSKPLNVAQFRKLLERIHLAAL